MTPLLSLAAQLLYANGQVTRSVTAPVERVGRSNGYSVVLFLSWGELVVRLKAPKIIAVDCAPANVDMNKVMKSVKALEEVSARQLDVSAASAALNEIARLGPTSIVCFAGLAGAGAAALAVIFGAALTFSLALIALSSAAGAVVRRFIAAHGNESPCRKFWAPLCFRVSWPQARLASWGSPTRLSWPCAPV